MTVMETGDTLVHVHTFSTISFVTKLTVAGKCTFLINASSVLVTIVGTKFTFVDVDAIVAVASESLSTTTLEGAFGVDALSTLVASHFGKQTRVQI